MKSFLLIFREFSFEFPVLLKCLLVCCKLSSSEGKTASEAARVRGTAHLDTASILQYNLVLPYCVTDRVYFTVTLVVWFSQGTCFTLPLWHGGGGMDRSSGWWSGKVVEAECHCHCPAWPTQVAIASCKRYMMLFSDVM